MAHFADGNVATWLQLAILYLHRLHSGGKVWQSNNVFREVVVSMLIRGFSIIREARLLS